jgi:FkbM family methyltransferase
MKQVKGIWIPDCDPDSWIEKAPLVDGVPAYQYEQLTACVRTCAARGLALALGAHVGLWAYHLATHFEQVRAFEPISMNFECLTKNVTSRPNVVCEQLAVSDRDGDLYMRHVKVKSFAFHVEDAGDIPVNCITIDSLNLDAVDLIKIDVEGHEYQALLGATETIERCHPVIMIEEKLDPEKCATRLLENLGMVCTWNLKFDYLFEW